jgi:hypothetical protein
MRPHIEKRRRWSSRRYVQAAVAQCKRSVISIRGGPRASQPRLGKSLFANYVTRSFCGVAILIMILILDWALRLALPWP